MLSSIEEPYSQPMTLRVAMLALRGAQREAWVLPSLLVLSRDGGGEVEDENKGKKIEMSLELTYVTTH